MVSSGRVQTDSWLLIFIVHHRMNGHGTIIPIRWRNRRRCPRFHHTQIDSRTPDPNPTSQVNSAERYRGLILAVPQQINAPRAFFHLSPNAAALYTWTRRNPPATSDPGRPPDDSPIPLGFRAKENKAYAMKHLLETGTMLGEPPTGRW